MFNVEIFYNTTFSYKKIYLFNLLFQIRPISIFILIWGKAALAVTTAAH